MITNVTTLTKKDFCSTERFRMLETLPLMILLFISGGYLLYKYVRYIYYLASPHYVVEKTPASVFAIVIFNLIGIVFIILGFGFPRVLSIISYKKTKSLTSLVRTYNFTDEGIETTVESNKLNQDAVFKYESMGGYYEMNEAIYVQLVFGKRKLYLIIHNDGYTSGTKEDAITLLEKNGIAKKNS